MMSEGEMRELQKLCRPIVDWLEGKGNPYITVEITVDSHKSEAGDYGDSGRKGG